MVELVGGSGLGISVGAPVGAPEGAEREATYNLSSCLNSPREVGSRGREGRETLFLHFPLLLPLLLSRFFLTDPSSFSKFFLVDG